MVLEPPDVGAEIQARTEVTAEVLHRTRVRLVEGMATINHSTCIR
jgi:hypothetical protein